MCGTKDVSIFGLSHKLLFSFAAFLKKPFSYFVETFYCQKMESEFKKAFCF